MDVTKKNDKAEQPQAGADVEKAIATLEALPGQVEIELKTARGDLRDALLEAFRNRPKVWSAMYEFEQRDVAQTLDSVAESLIVKVAQVLATAGNKVVAGTLDGLTIKDGMKITIKAPMTHEAIDALADATGKQVMVCRVMSGIAMGQRKPAKIDPDQPDLIPEGDADLAGDDAPDGGKPADPPLADPAQEADAALAE